jgi:SLAP domain-containing protein
MKRKIILSSIIAILLVSLMGCGQGKKETAQQLETTKVEEAAKDTASEQKKNETENETSKANKDADINKENLTKQSNTNMFINGQPIFLENCININPDRVYYDGDSLVLDAYVTNGFNSTAYNIGVDNITLSNESGVIASAKFGGMKGASIGPHQYIKWTFTFPAASIKKQNADLNYLHTQSKIGCNN